MAWKTVEAAVVTDQDLFQNPHAKKDAEARLRAEGRLDVRNPSWVRDQSSRTWTLCVREEV